MYHYFVFVIVVVVCSAEPEYDSYEALRDNADYKHFLANLVKAVKRNSGTIISDHGYGSRLRAGRNIADAVTAYNDVFGAYGPGKRSVSVNEPDDDSTATNLSKRYLSDHGYGSRISAGKAVAQDRLIKQTLFGIHGPGKRSGYLRLGRDGATVGDAGYLSRIDAAKTLAYGVEARNNLFGDIGPGRR